jgi:hypothetical protein
VLWGSCKTSPPGAVAYARRFGHRAVVKANTKE